MERIRLNAQIVKQNIYKTSSLIFAVLSGLFLFFGWSDVRDDSFCLRLGCFILICVIIVAIALGVTFTKRKNTIWSSGNSRLNIVYADLLDLMSDNNKNNDKSRIVVIPVNTCFDTVVEDCTTNTKPLVSSNSLHGLWINRINSTLAIDELDSRIEANLAEQNVRYSVVNRSHGKTKEYPIGSISAIKWNNVVFYLLALTRFDDDNKAQCSEDELFLAICELIKYYDANGQANPMFIPIIGTGLSRIGFSHIDALNRMEAIFEIKKTSIHGEVNILIYSGDKDKVSIYS